MIDLSTLIALLTALAAAAPSAPPDLPGPAADPPARTCSAPTTARPTPSLPSPSTGDRTRRPGPSETADPDRSDQDTADQDTTRSTPDKPGPTSTDRFPLTDPDRSDPPRTEEFLRLKRAGPPDDTAPNDNPQDTGSPDPEGEDPDGGKDPEKKNPQNKKLEETEKNEAEEEEPGPPDAESRNEKSQNNEPQNNEPRQERSTRAPRPEDPACDRTTEPNTPSTTGARVPADLVDLDNWYLTLPTGNAGDPDTVEVPTLIDYSSNYFQLNDAQDGVVFTAPVDGATTRNSSYPRSELREMDGPSEASWSNSTGTHTLRATEAITELPESKPEIVAAQIHGGDDDVMQIRLEGSRLMVQYADGAEQVVLDPQYRLGTPYDIEILAADNAVQVAYNGEKKADLPLSGSTWYFKAGAYVQSNPEKGDAASATGQVIIYSLEVTHR